MVYYHYYYFDSIGSEFIYVFMGLCRAMSFFSFLALKFRVFFYLDPPREQVALTPDRFCFPHSIQKND